MNTKKPVMTPLHLEILLHYYHATEDWAMLGQGCHDEYAVRLCIHDLLHTSEDPCKYQITDKGRFYVEHLLTVPLPVSTFKIPEASNV